MARLPATSTPSTTDKHLPVTRVLTVKLELKSMVKHALIQGNRKPAVPENDETRVLRCSFLTLRLEQVRDLGRYALAGFDQRDAQSVLE